MKYYPELDCDLAPHPHKSTRLPLGLSTILPLSNTGSAAQGLRLAPREWPSRRPLRAVWVGPETHQHPAVPHHEDSCFVKYR